MSDDASTAYICIYCPFNSDNLQALESHLASAHEHGCQDEPDSSNRNVMTNKREAPDDEKFSLPFNNAEGVKRVKRTPSSSPVATNFYTNSSDENSDIDEEDGDERDSSNLIQHQLNLTKQIKSTEHQIEHHQNSETSACPYCDFKSTDIEQFTTHIIAHIRDKSYRCLLCNRLYKYRGDCSFHIRRKHHRYSLNSNDYIQRFLFDTSESDDPTNAQSLTNNSTNSNSINREQDEPIRYFSCPYCDYTSNYGGDVRKHQARKHPNAESKVVKIIRQDSEIPNRVDEDNDDEPHSSKSKSSKPQLKQSSAPLLPSFAPVRVFECSSCHQQGTYKWVVERHIRAKHPDQSNVHVIELPAELSVKLQKITSPLKRYRCSLCPLQSKHSWVVIRHIKHFHTLQTASVLDIQTDGKAIGDEFSNQQNDEFANKFSNHDSESSSTSSFGLDDENLDDNSMLLIYKCSLCDYQSNISINIQKHLNENHSDQTNAYMITQCRGNKSADSIKKPKPKNGFHRPLSPTSALAKAKFSPAVEQALLSLQTSKLDPNLYAVQPKFGIKRLKCRHCFYRSNWKTDMIRHVRIRHNLTEPDHNKDLIIMSEQEARSTIESYENTFGKELRRRTFRTWNDWTKAEQEFTPKDGSLQYINTNNEQTKSSKKKSSNQINESKQKKTDDIIQLPNPSNIVSRLLLTSSPSHQTDNDAPLDLSLKPSNSKNNSYAENPTVFYLCSVCPYKHSNWSTIQEHISFHLTGQGFVCSHCSYLTVNEYQMNEHYTKTHPTSQHPRKYSPTSVNLTARFIEQYQCSLCSYQCDRFESLNNHRRFEHDDEEFDIDSSEDEYQATTSKNPYDCPLCSPIHCQNLEQLTIHVVARHHNQSCPFCSYSIPSKSNENLTEHVKLHFNGALVQPDPIHGIEQVKELCVLE